MEITAVTFTPKSKILNSYESPRHPTHMSATGIEAEVCADIAKRQQLGIAKYGVTVAENPLQLKQWLEHAYQEALDLAVYLKRSMVELESL